MQCPHCKGLDCTEIEIRLKEDDSVKFYSCRRCEAKWWQHQGDTIELDQVLSLTAERQGR
jgi:Zn-finger nucleic acid-binding protein